MHRRRRIPPSTTRTTPFPKEFASPPLLQDSETAEIDDNDIDSEGDGLDKFDDFIASFVRKFSESQTMEESWAEQKAQN